MAAIAYQGLAWVSQGRVKDGMALLDEEDSVAAIELGLNDDISPADAESFTLSAVEPPKILEKMGGGRVALLALLASRPHAHAHGRKSG